MFRAVLPLCLATALCAAAGAAPVRDDGPKSDADAKVAEGAEVSLTPAEVTTEEKRLDDGRAIAVAKPGKAAKVKMPAQAYLLGVTAEPFKGGGIKITQVNEKTALTGMRIDAGKADTPGPWSADAGDVITHANGYAVSSVNELLVAVSTAKKPDDVQLVITDVNSGKASVFYVTAIKR